MKFAFVVFLLLIFTACQENTPAESEYKDITSEEIESHNERAEIYEEEVAVDHTDIPPYVPFVYEVDPIEYPLQGTINGDTIYMQLDFHAHTITGKYMYKKYKKPIPLEGYYTLKGFILNELANEGKVSAYFLAEGSYRNFSGKWFKTDKVNNGSVKLALIDSYGVFLEPTDKFTALGQEGPSEYAIEHGLDANCPDCISLRSMNKPNQYLRHQGFQIKQHA